ncbi:MAG: PEP-CTERM system histidine kinase PrsK [Gammaproteobacteria bacterium]|nr:PEP-CTERM system histidine kinase PrsK [Gammaproteobacteria bacterium]
MFSIGVISYGLAGLSFLTIFVLLLTMWRQRTASIELAVAMLAGLLWAIASAHSAYHSFASNIWAVSLEIIRNLLWSYLLLKLIRTLSQSRGTWYAVLERISYVIPLLLLALLLFVASGNTNMGSWLGFEVRIIGHLVLALLGLILVEQVFRSSREQRWAFKFLCIGFGAVYIHDFYLYSEALLFQRVDIDNWSSRGVVSVFAMVLLGLGIRRFPDATLSITVSRQVIFYSSAVLAAGVYLLIVAGGGYYLREYGGDWGTIIRNAFVFGALMVLLAVVSSGGMRGRLRVFIDKHFLNYRYDYREEWLRLIRQLSSEHKVERLEEKAIVALADMVDSPGGVLWINQKNRGYEAVAHMSMSDLNGMSEAADASLPRFLEQWQWVINLHEYRDGSVLYADLQLPQWLKDQDSAWLVVPLMLQTQLYGFIILANPRAPRQFNWEDIDLLKTAGRQVAIHLAQARSALALAESRQFEAFNRLSAYVMHDLKNLMSQLGLVVKNAEKHKHNPAFVDDAINTVENAVARMNRLLAQLKTGTLSSEKAERVPLSEILSTVVKDKATSRPVPELNGGVEELFVIADKDRLVSNIGHLVQNAQDATPPNGKITVSIARESGNAVICVTDTGSGMDENFIRNRLFKPFDSTKGLTGMGIGAHEVRQFIEDMGGSVSVRSTLGEGTTFRLELPLA